MRKHSTESEYFLKSVKTLADRYGFVLSQNTFDMEYGTYHYIFHNKMFVVYIVHDEKTILNTQIKCLESEKFYKIDEFECNYFLALKFIHGILKRFDFK